MVFAYMVFARIGKQICAHGPLVILTWLLVLIALRFWAPHWDDITRDGDFQYLPADRPSVVGQQLLNEAFPNRRSKSQIVVIVSRNQGEPKEHDLYIAYEMARRFHNMAGAAAIGMAEREHQALQQETSDPETTAVPSLAELLSADSLPENSREFAIQEALMRAQSELDHAVELTRKLFDYFETLAEKPAPHPDAIADRELAHAFHNRAYLQRIVEQTEAAGTDQQIADNLCGDRPLPQDQLFPAGSSQLPITETWTWQTDGFGRHLLDLRGKLAYARLIILHLPTEFLAVENMALFDLARQEVAAVNDWASGFEDDGIEVAISGSAAVGSDLLVASVESTRHTELFTIILVTLILALVYRSPLLIGLPLITIGVSLGVSISVLAAMTQIQYLPAMAWFDFNVYKTTRIFIVVILFGAGTDYCLFLVARYREELERGLPYREALETAIRHVGPALAASALTTIVGLGMMFFAEFGKLRNSGPAIAICLAITLLACLTLAPAILRAYGRWAFWPLHRRVGSQANRLQKRELANQSTATPAYPRWKPTRLFWHYSAWTVTKYPGRVLVVSFMLIAPLAIYGWRQSDHVTYDMLQSLSPTRPSRIGAERLREHFPVGESGPVIVLAEHPTDSFVSADGAYDRTKLAQIDRLEKQLRSVPGVEDVRSLASPLGSRWGGQGVYTTSLRALPQIQAQYVTQDPDLNHRVTRFEVVLKYDPFSIEATHVINQIEQLLQRLHNDSGSQWGDYRFSFAGTSAAIRDLRLVTQSDTIRIEILVVIAVFLVLLSMLHRPIVCSYMIATVLISFFATVGMTDLFFAWTEGANYQGLDWKVPLFLFVILVAVGEDYNVYLATRIYEEQASHGLRAGLYRAVTRTGGIISSCGVIMAGTFITMTSGTWGEFLPGDLPLIGRWFQSSGGTLKGLVQMGFALSLGVMIDTFFVRPVLLPAFISLLDRYRQRSQGGKVHRECDRDV